MESEGSCTFSVLFLKDFLNIFFLFSNRKGPNLGISNLILGRFPVFRNAYFLDPSLQLITSGILCWENMAYHPAAQNSRSHNIRFPSTQPKSDYLADCQKEQQ